MTAQDPWMIAVLLCSPMPTPELESLLGATVERVESRHDLTIKPTHSLLTRCHGKLAKIDLFDHQWHDSSGDDAGPTSPQYAWRESHEHLLAPPWSLKNAVQQYRGPDDAAIAAAKHSAYVLLRIPHQSEGNTLASFESLVELALRILAHPSACCYFNPRGQVLCANSRLKATLERYRGSQLPPLDLLINTRIFDIGAGWSLVDTIGLPQLTLPDQEVLFAQTKLQAADAMNFARNLAMHFITHAPVVETAETASGPNESIWEALVLEGSAIPPHRPVIRWLPEDREGMPSAMGVP